MPKRRLTSQYVSRVRTPRKGERWIADTEVRGFGLRLWAGGRPGKAFAIRMSNGRGGTVRRTVCAGYGPLLDHARGLARRIINESRGTDRHKTARDKWIELIPFLTLNEWVEKFLAVKKLERKDLTDLADLYNRLAEPTIGAVQLVHLTTEAVVACIRNVAKSTPGQARNLQSFLHQALAVAGQFHPNPRRIARRMNRHPNYYRKRRADFPEIELSMYQDLYRRLLVDQDNRQVALFLLFAFHVGRRPKECLVLSGAKSEAEGISLVSLAAKWSGHISGRSILSLN